MNTSSHFQASNLSCIRQQKKLFANISFELQPGSILLIEGANGSGKSSLLRLLSGLATPFEGEVKWKGNLHYVGHANGLKLGLTVEENLALLRHCEEPEGRRGNPEALSKNWIAASPSAPRNDEEVLALLQLHTQKHTLAKHLSAGQKRRLALAKLFLFPKSLWILDEPLTALDTDTQQIIISALEDHTQKGGMAIITSHQPIAFKNTKVNVLRLGI